MAQKPSPRKPSLNPRRTTRTTAAARTGDLNPAKTLDFHEQGGAGEWEWERNRGGGFSVYRRVVEADGDVSEKARELLTLPAPPAFQTEHTTGRAAHAHPPLLYTSSLPVRRGGEGSEVIPHPPARALRSVSGAVRGLRSVNLDRALGEPGT